MQSTSSDNLSPVLRYLTLVASTILLGAGVALLFFAGPMVKIWPWPINAGTSRFLGAVYLASLVPLAMQALRYKWQVVHFTLPMIVVFTTAMMVISLASLSGFLFDLPTVWVWFAIYITLPFITGFFLRKYWGQPIPDSLTLTGAWPTVLRVWAALHLLYALALIIAPGPATSWWPWKTELMDARIYCSPFLTFATGAFLLSRPTHRDALVVFGWTQVVLGVTALAGRGVPALFGGYPGFTAGIIVWHAYFVLVLLVGIALLRTARRLSSAK